MTTLEDVRVACVALMKREGRETASPFIFSVLAEYGVERLTLLPEDKLPGMLAAVERRLYAFDIYEFRRNEQGGVEIPQGTRVPSGTVVPANSVLGDDCTVESECVFGMGCGFGWGCIFGQGCQFGAACKFNRQCDFGQSCYFERDCDFSSYCTFGSDCRFGRACRFEHARFGAQCVFDRRCTFMSCTFGSRCRIDETTSIYGSRFEPWCSVRKDDGRWHGLSATPLPPWPPNGGEAYTAWLWAQALGVDTEPLRRYLLDIAHMPLDADWMAHAGGQP